MEKISHHGNIASCIGASKAELIKQGEHRGSFSIGLPKCGSDLVVILSEKEINLMHNLALGYEIVGEEEKLIADKLKESRQVYLFMEDGNGKLYFKPDRKFAWIEAVKNTYGDGSGQIQLNYNYGCFGKN